MANFKHFRKFNKFAALLLILLSIIMLAACNSAKNSPLVGKWELTEDISFLGITIYPKGAILEFYPDGNADFMSYGCKYEDLGDKIKIIQGSDFFYLEYELEGDTLTVIDEGAGGALGYPDKLVYKRVK